MSNPINSDDADRAAKIIRDALGREQTSSTLLPEGMAGRS
jgi:hypothetical protein